MSLASQLETLKTAQLVHQIMPALEELNLTLHIVIDIDGDKFPAIRNIISLELFRHRSRVQEVIIRERALGFRKMTSLNR